MGKTRVPIQRKVRVTPEGSREVDPLSIIGSKSIIDHLKNIRGIGRVVVKKPATR